MPTPSFGRRKLSPNAKALENLSKEEDAKTAVGLVESLISQLYDTRASFSTDFPEAAAELEGIKHLEDSVTEAISDAKLKVAAAGVSIGDFQCMLKNSSPGYDPHVLVDTLASVEECGEVILRLIKAGVLTEIRLDNTSVQVFMDRNKDIADVLQPAWRESHPLTPAVKVPKI